MCDIKSEVRQLIEASGRSLKSISQSSEVSYDKLKRWYNHQTKVLDAADASSIVKTLTGRGLTR